MGAKKEMKKLTPQQLNKVWKTVDYCITRQQMYNAIMWVAKLKLQKSDDEFIYHMISSESFNERHKNDK